MQISYIFFPIFILISPVSILSQTFSSQQIISTSANGARDVSAADIDLDGDFDVVSASSYINSEIVWYENTDGNGTFGVKKIITISADGARSVCTVDLDNDSDIDVVSASKNDNKLAWYENTDSHGTFSSQKIITTSALGVESLYCCDLNGDQNLDMLTCLRSDNKIVWYENNSDGSFSAEQEIIKVAELAYPGDIDGDGDIDIITCSDVNDKLIWHENIDGKGNFGSQHIVASGLENAHNIFKINLNDLDGDGDPDILFTCTHDDRLAWLENTDGKGSFQKGHIIVNSVEYAYAGDINGDGYLDLVTTQFPGNKIMWYEFSNVNRSFVLKNMITDNVNRPKAVYFANLDGDNDIDLISASLFDNKVAWYRNLTNPTSIQDNQSNLPNIFQLQQNYPNPFNPSTTIKYDLSKPGNVILKIYNLSGQELETLVNGFPSAGEHEITWHPKGLASGIYFYRLQAGGFTDVRKMIFME